MLLPRAYRFTITWPSVGSRLSAVTGERHRFLLVGLGLLCIALILMLKHLALPSFFSDPLLFSYAVFVTIFQLSRVTLSLFFRNPHSGEVLPDGSAKYEPMVTFVIPCKNEGKVIASTVDKCFEADYPEEKLEVIVINDGSTDDTLAMLLRAQTRHKNLVVVNWEQNRGKRHGMYEGFNRARGEIVIQLDSDSFIDPKTFRKLIEPFADPRIAAVCAHATPSNADANLVTRMQAAFYFNSFRIMKAAESVTSTVMCCSGCCSAYRRSAVEPILDQWLAEKFFGKPVTWGDDRALTSWMLKTGHKTVYTDAAQAFTVVPDTWKQLMKQQLRWKKGWIVNSCITSRFIFKAHPLLAALYYFPLVAISLITPIMTFRAMFFSPVVNTFFPSIYFLGGLSMAALMAIYYYYKYQGNKYWPYGFVWAAFNMFVLSYLMIYALFKLQDRRWATR